MPRSASSIYVALSLALVLSASQSTALNAILETRDVSDPEAYAVYAAVLPQEWPVRQAHATRVVLQRETVTNWSCFASGKPLETDWRPVVEDFRKENAVDRSILPTFDLGSAYELVDRNTLHSLVGTNGDWRAFYASYPDSGGYIAVSAVGFDEARTRAIVYMEHHCGGLCGGGFHHFLEKRNGRWVPARLDISVCGWNS